MPSMRHARLGRFVSLHFGLKLINLGCILLYASKHECKQQAKDDQSNSKQDEVALAHGQ